MISVRYMLYLKINFDLYYTHLNVIINASQIRYEKLYKKKKILKRRVP